MRRVGIVADRGMISPETITAWEQDERGWQDLRGARMRAQTEVRDEVLSQPVALGSCIRSGSTATTPQP